MVLDLRLELREVVHSALAVSGCNHIMRVLADVLSNLAPGGLDSLNGVGEGAVLWWKGVVGTELSVEEGPMPYHVK
jgi:hypothetical protein